MTYEDDRFIYSSPDELNDPYCSICGRDLCIGMQLLVDIYGDVHCPDCLAAYDRVAWSARNRAYPFGLEV